MREVKFRIAEKELHQTVIKADEALVKADEAIREAHTAL